jgi:uncharacterized protein YqgC (DUF456 family)
MDIAVGIVVALVALVGIALTAMTLPGTWLAIVGALLAQWWYMEYHDGDQMFSWWSIGACVALAIIAEIVEFFASAVGAAKAGGTRRGAIGSIIGGLVGAIVGQILIPVPILGAILGATIGAGLGASVGERTRDGVTLKQAATVGAGAAAGRFAATIAKTGFAAAIAVIIVVDVCW